MRALHVTDLTGPDALQVVDVPEPVGGPDDVVVDVKACGVAWPDLLLTRGEYQIKPQVPFSPGAEVAGTVRSAPAGSGLSAGDPVVAVCGVGGWQETVALPAASVLALPAGFDLSIAAGLPFNALTVHFALTRRGQVKEGDTVLVHGASGGIGIAAVQLAKAYGARVLAVVSTEAKVQAAQEAGADEVLLVDGFKDRVKELTGGRGVDIVVDPVGGDRFTDSLRSLAPEGRLLVIGFTGGEIPQVKVNRLLLNNVSVVGVGWGAFLLTAPDYMQQQWAELRALIESGAFVPPAVVERPFEEAAQVLRSMDDRTLVGKAVLAV